MPITDDEQRSDELATVLAWRKERLRDMHDVHGHRFTIRQIRILADNGCDLHEAAAMLAVGCSIPICFDILS
jgi:hypothetical protein